MTRYAFWQVFYSRRFVCLGPQAPGASRPARLASSHKLGRACALAAHCVRRLALPIQTAPLRLVLHCSLVAELGRRLADRKADRPPAGPKGPRKSRGGGRTEDKESGA